MDELYTQICDMTGAEQARMIRDKKISPVEVMDEVFERIEQLNGKYNAFCTLDEDNARDAARKADYRQTSGRLDGVARISRLQTG